MDVSVVSPVYNEEGNLEPMYSELKQVLDQNFDEWEVIFVDDGSNDGSLKVLENMYEKEPCVKAISFKTNFGQTEALQAGIDAASGDVIVTIDSDMQNDPEDIPRLVEKLEEGYDCVVGWRKNREDPFMKRLSSRFAAFMRRKTLGTDLHDYGCTLKAFRRETAKSLTINGEMHRYIPPIIERRGYSTTEIVVNHRERHEGETTYSWQRLPKGFLDMINVWFWQKYEGRPLHIFGGMGVLSMTLGGLLFLYALFQKMTGTSLTDTAATVISIFLILIGVQFFISGILADISIHSYHTSRERENYNVEKVLE